MDQKKVDKLFQKQLQNLEIAPNKKTWTHIETSLKKKKRRVIPFWLFPSAIAAIVVLSFSIFAVSTDENSTEKKNADEIITISPKNRTILKKNIDALILDQNIPTETLITKKDKLFKNRQNTKSSFSLKQQHKYIIPKTPAKSIVLRSHQINTDFLFIDKTSIFKINERLDKAFVSQKIDIHTFLVSKDASKITKSTEDRWAVAPLFAVLKSNSFSNTSPIDANLAHSTKGDHSISYGVQIAYKINKKWTIQSGIHLQEMSYSNSRIAVFSSSQENGSTIAFNSEDSFSFDGNIAERVNFTPNSLTNSISYKGNLIQNYGYVEIPIELKYNFSNKKDFKTQIVTGISSLFLNKNSIHLNSENISKEGRASNLNTLNFSGNLGFDFNYLLDENWSLNLNPMLKIQFNTFNENANNFAPFYIGLYTGIRYQF
jgi:hypothetical protein